ncbi:MAG TPA: hypothetical protein VKF37_01440 [Chloroflexota bacterium]|nr:hypothetical protein [Chloroflexota bacterium]
MVAFDPAPRTRGQSGLSLLLPMPTQCLHDRLRQLNGVLVVRLGLGQPVLAVLTPDPYPFEGAPQLELSSTEVDVVPLQAKYLALTHANHQRQNEECFVLVCISP